MNGEDSTQSHGTAPEAADSARLSPLDPMALSLEEVARLLSRVGGKRVSIEDVQADVAAGAPISAAGRMNLVHYAAWLIHSQGSEAER
jgi:hypothetical protein